MKHLSIFFIAVIVMAAALVISLPASSGDAIEEVELHGISERPGSILKTAVDTSSRTAYPTITWYLFTPDNVHITHTAAGEILLDEDITAGYHSFTFTYEVGSTIMSWAVDDSLFNYRLRITDTTSGIIPEEDQDMVTFTPAAWERFVEDLRNNTILFTLLFFVIPAPWMYWYWKNKRSEGYIDVFYE